MITSMTAFARQSGDGDWRQTVWELRSVNHRYLDVSIKLPEALRGFENAVRERIAHRLQRGKIDCNLRHESPSADNKLGLNWDLARQLGRAADELKQVLPNLASVNAIDILRWPGVVASDQIDLDELSAKLLPLLDQALDVLVSTRQREGAKLKAILEERCEHAAACVTRLRAQIPQIIGRLKDRLNERLQEIGPALEPGRLEQEVLLAAQKMDIAEELDRLDAHVGEVRRLLNEAGPNGRRLDFLMQELNREANTIASKSAHIDTTGAAVDLKVLIEQMREQIQNIE
jgi:uncharacterized protein (TIGR00255 family)